MENETAKTKRIAKNTLILYFRMLFLMAISLYTSRVILDALGIEDYGIYNVVGGFVGMFALISSALSNANSRFLNYEMGKGNASNLQTVFSSLVTIQFALAILIFVSCEIIGNWYVCNKMVLPLDRLSAAKWCLHISIFNFCTDLVTVPYRAAIIAHEKMKTFAYVSLFEGLAKLGICFLVMISKYDRLVMYAVLLLMVQLIIRTSYQLYCRKKFKECHYQFVFDKAMLKKMFAYSGWHFIGNSANILKNSGIDVILNLFFGPSINAAKGVANQVLHAIQGFSNNFTTALNPQIIQSYAQGNVGYMMKLVYKGSRFSFYILFLIALPIVVNADYIVNVWLKNVPPYAIVFVQLSVIVAALSSLSNTLITAQNATGNVRNYQLIVGGIQLLNLPMSYFCLYLGFSPVCVLLVSIFVEIFSLVARLVMIPFYISSFHRLVFLKEVVLNCFLVVVCAAMLPFVVSKYFGLNDFISCGLNVMLCFLCSAVSIMFVGCSRKERERILSGIKAKFH